jgi:O-antigen/teichoic acid export membrane protein
MRFSGCLGPRVRPSDDPISPTTVSRSHFSLFSRPRAVEAVLISTQVLGFVTSVIIARSVGPQGRGLITALAVWSQILAWISCFSMDKAVVVLANESVNREVNPDSLFVVARRQLLWNLGFVSLPAVVIGVWILRDTLLVVSFMSAVVAIAFWELWNGYLMATKRRETYLRLRLAQPVAYLLLIGMIAVPVQNASFLSEVRAMGAAVFVSVAVPVIVSYRRSYPTPTDMQRSLRAELLRFAASAELAAFLQFLNTRLDVLLLPFAVSPSQVGIYAIAVAPAQTIVFLGSAGVFRALIREGPQRDVRALVAIAAISLTWCLLAPRVIVLLFGSPFATAALPARILAVGSIFGFALQLVSGRLLGSGRTGSLAAAQGLGAAVFIVGFSLAHTLAGVALANAVSYVASLAFAEALDARNQRRAPKPPA